MKHRTARKSPNGGAVPTNGHAALVRELWQAAVNLRGAIEPADYKRYVLPIILLRFLSLRYEQRREELRLLVSPELVAGIREDGCFARRAHRQQ